MLCAHDVHIVVLTDIVWLYGPFMACVLFVHLSFVIVVVFVFVLSFSFTATTKAVLRHCHRMPECVSIQFLQVFSVDLAFTAHFVFIHFVSPIFSSSRPPLRSILSQSTLA